MFELPPHDEIVARALAEDLGVAPERFAQGATRAPDLLRRDATSSAVLDAAASFSGVVVARQACTIAGLPVLAAVFDALSRAAGLPEPVECFPLVAEGARVAAGGALAEVDGPAAAVLAAERTALDFLMVLSGIATETARWVDAAAGAYEVCDTRKTMPGLRELSKYAVRVGGGANHRVGLFDMVLVKDNHLSRVGGVTEAVRRAREGAPGLLVEIEADTVDEAVEAVRAGADAVLLDNMDDVTLARAVGGCREAARERGRAVVCEASGGIRYERLASLAATGVDRVSTSAITLASPVDIALDERREAS